MKNNLIAFLGAFALIATLASTSFANDEHHPEEKKEAAKTQTMPADGMMGKMDQNQMMGMMHECMDMHKDGKMCEHETMEKCQKDMKKDDCQKMMKQAKKQDKAKK